MGPFLKEFMKVHLLKGFIQTANMFEMAYTKYKRLFEMLLENTLKTKAL